MTVLRLLAGRTALVTGSSSGIGLQIAQALAASGANVLLHGLMEPATADALVTKISANYSVKAAVSTHDLSKGDEVAKMVSLCQTQLGPVDILVNNAGIQHVSPIEDFSKDWYDKIIAVNLTAPWLASKAVVGEMRRRRFGRIVNVASVHGLVASTNKSAYVASKHGIVGLTKALALETAGSGVTVNAICPGWVLTPLVQAQIDARAAKSGKIGEDEARQMVIEKQPSGQFVQAGDIAALTVFLCSETAGQMTGASLPVDGGWTAQ